MLKFCFKKFVLPLLAAALVFVLVDHDAMLYRQPVARVTAVATRSTASTDDFGNHDRAISQRLTLQALNRPADTPKQLTATTTLSQTTGQIYRVGQKVILEKGQIVTLKRDALTAALVALLIGLFIAFIRLRATIFLVCSLALDLIYFILALLLDIRLTALAVPIFVGLALVFCASALLFVLGPSRQMVYTFVTTATATALTFALTLGVLAATGNAGVHFEYMNYVTQNPAIFFFIASTISVLGAIMDGCGDIVAGLFGIARQRPDTSRRAYFRSGIAIGREIVGTLSNVLFMIFMAETLPMTFLLLRNGNNWSYIATVALNLGLLQTLISAIGILLSLPVTAALTSLGLSRRARDRGGLS